MAAGGTGFEPMNTNTEIAPWLVLDIETREGRPEDVESWILQHWWPQEKTDKDSGKKVLGLKPITTLKKLEELIEEKYKKLGLMDAAPLGTVQLHTPTATLLLHTFYHEEPRWLETEKGAAIVMGFGAAKPAGAVDYSPEEMARQVENERLLMVFLCDWLERYTDDKTTIVGWNVKGFDLPRLRLMCLRARPRIVLPKVFQVRADVYDLMKEYCRHFSVDRVEFMKLVVALEQVGIATNKEVMNGAMVGPMIRAGRYEEVLVYGLGDVVEETELFLMMSPGAARYVVGKAG